MEIVNITCVVVQILVGILPRCTCQRLVDIKANVNYHRVPFNTEISSVDIEVMSNQYGQFLSYRFQVLNYNWREFNFRSLYLTLCVYILLSIKMTV